MKQHTLRLARGSVNLDGELPQLDPLKVLQMRIDEANRIIHEHDPMTIVDALAMEARARAEVWQIVAAELNGVTK